MKRLIQIFLQKILGFETYLYFLSLYKIYTYKYNKWEKDFHFFLSMLNENSVVLDIGANVGVMTVLLAKKLKDGMVYSFEPVSVNYRALQRVILKFKLKNAILFNFALGNKARPVKMKMPIRNSLKMTGYSYISDFKNSDSDKSIEFDAEVRVLDHLRELNCKKVDAMKIDVEGYEQFVLEGSIETIKKNLPLIFAELTDIENQKRSFELLQKIGYKVYFFDGSKLAQYKAGNIQPVNYFFIPT